MIMHELHNTTSRAEAAMWNIWTKKHKRRFSDSDDLDDFWQAIYSSNDVEVVK